MATLADCPKCGAEWVCPCQSCTIRRGTRSAWKFEGDYITCPCGLKKHCDWWLDREMEAYKKSKETEKDSNDDCKVEEKK